MFIIAITVSILAGVALVLARTINADLAKNIGLMQGTLVNYITGLLGSLLLLVISGTYLPMTKQELVEIPYWAYFGGLAGILVVALSSYLVHRISAFYLTLFIFTGQMVTGLVIDFFLDSGIPVGKTVGGILVLGGLIYNLYIDKKIEV